jgi:pimeloyl-ACP methyl ester carboxylesterase
MPEQPCDNPFIVEFIGRHSLRRAEDGWVWKFDSEAMGSRRFGEPVREYLQAVGCRAALIFGENSALVSRETASYMSSLMGPRAPVVEVPDARHHVMLDQPVGFVAALRMLLDGFVTATGIGLKRGNGRSCLTLLRRRLAIAPSPRL